MSFLYSLKSGHLKVPLLVPTDMSSSDLFFLLLHHVAKSKSLRIVKTETHFSRRTPKQDSSLLVC